MRHEAWEQMMNGRILVCAMLLTGGVVHAEPALVSPSPEGATLYFITPAEGDTVASPVTVRFGLRGMGVAPAGVDKADTGHHHLLIDDPELPPPGQPLPATAQIVHFGGGQTEASIELSPGSHSLQLLLGNHLHIPHEPPVMSEKITITVE
jgi:hypothetical protein